MWIILTGLCSIWYLSQVSKDLHLIFPWRNLSFLNFWVNWWPWYFSDVMVSRKVVILLVQLLKITNIQVKLFLVFYFLILIKKKILPWISLKQFLFAYILRINKINSLNTSIQVISSINKYFSDFRQLQTPWMRKISISSRQQHMIKQAWSIQVRPVGK